MLRPVARLPPLQPAAAFSPSSSLEDVLLAREGSQEIVPIFFPSVPEASAEQCSKERAATGLRQDGHSPVCTPGSGRGRKSGNGDNRASS